MKNYKVFKSVDNDKELFIEVFNSCDVYNVQKEFVNKGYVIKLSFDTVTGSSFIKAYKMGD